MAKPTKAEKKAEKKERALARALVEEFAPQIEAIGFEKGHTIGVEEGRRQGLMEAAECTNIRDVKKLAKEATGTDPENGAADDD